MSSQIGPVGPSYFSLEAFCGDSQQVSSSSLLQRALLSLQKQYRVAVSSRTIPQGQAFAVPEEWITGIVFRLMTRIPSRGLSRISLQQDNIKALESFLLELRDPGNSIEALRAQFDSLGESMREILCRWVWHADREPDGGLQYGKDQIQGDPRYLLSFADENGNNIIERLIEFASIEPLNIVIKQCDRETFNSVEPILVDKSCKKTLYMAIARGFAKKFVNTSTNPLQRGRVLSQITLIDALYVRCEIAKLCAQQDGRGTACCIQKMGVRDPEHLLEVAKLCAQQDGRGTSEYIQNFWIRDPDHLFEVAKLCAQQSGEWTAYYIEKFGIRDPDHLFEIAKLCAKRNGRDTASYMQNFGIRDPEHLFEIAKLCTKQNRWGISCYIRNFKIAEEDHRFEIAKLCAKKNGSETVLYIRDFGITDAEHLFEIAKLCAQQDGEYVFSSIDTVFFHLTSRQQARLRNLCVWRMVSSLELSDSGKNHFVAKVFPSVRKKLSSEKYRFFMGAFPAPQGELEGQIRQRKDRDILENHPENISELSPQAMAKISAIQYILDEFSEGPIHETIQAACIEIFTYRNLCISFSCLLELSSFMQNPIAVETYEALISTINRISSGIVHLRLPMLMVAKWMAACEKSTALEHACEGIKQCIMRQKSPFKNAYSGLMQTWLLTCLALEHQTELSAEEKIPLLHKATSALDPKDPAEDLKKRLSCLQALVMVQQEALRKIVKEPIENLTEHVSNLIATALSQNPDLGLEKVDHLTDKYLSTLAAMRVPNAWSAYAARIKQTENPEVQKAFQHALIEILEGRHRESRYADESSPHIIRIVQTHKEVWDRWKLPHEGQIVSSDLAEESSSFSFQEYLRTKCGDGHLQKADSTTLVFLTAVVKSSPETAAKQIECQEMAVKSDDPLLLAQDLLIGLYLGKGSETEILEKKEDLERAIHALRDYEIANDLQGLLEGLSKSQSQRQKVLVIDTDDWQDLFLCGTEVAGSCQRVDGEPHLNKCLLAYLIDGKNRMLAVKDPASGKILARALFRMLWDPIKQKPVLFRDRIYPDPCPPAHKKALDGLAQKRAQALGLALYVQGDLGDPGAVLIRSLGSKAPFEYEDAVEGVMEKGVFTIEKTTEMLL